MSKYEADVWLGSHSGRQRLYVDSNTWYGAREQLKNIYGVGDNDIWDLTEVKENRNNYRSSYHSSDDETEGGFLTLVLAFLVIQLFSLLMNCIIIIGPIALLTFLMYKLGKPKCVVRFYEKSLNKLNELREKIINN